MYFILSEQERGFRFAPCDILQNLNNIFSYKYRLYGVKRKQVFSSHLAKSIDFISISTDQFTSLGTGIIPFLEHNDANRALMGSNMQRQSLPLLEKEMPLIETGRECLVVKESESTVIARRSGKIIYSSPYKIVIEEIFKPLKYMNANIFLEKFISDNFFYEKENFKKTKTIRTTYLLGSSHKSNHSVFQKKNTIVKKSDWVKAGQILTDNMGTLKGNLAFGKNILVGYLGWEGYNFEDAVIINERLITEDVFTSVHIKKFKTFFISQGEKEVRIL